MFRRWRYEWEAGIRAGGRRRSEGLRLDGDTSAWPTDSRDCDCARNLEASGKKHLSQSRELMSYETTEIICLGGRLIKASGTYTLRTW